MLRGSRDFESRDAYEQFLVALIDQRNAIRSQRLNEELRPARSRPSNRQRFSRPDHEIWLLVRVVAQFQSPRGFRALYVTTTEFAPTQAFLELSADSAPHT